MKTFFKIFRLLLLISVSALTTNAQTGFTLGVKGGITLGQPKAYASTQVLKFDGVGEIQNPSLRGNDAQIGLTGRYDFEKYYLFSEVEYAKMQNSFYITSPRTGSGQFGKPRQINAGLGGGVKPLPWLRFYTSVNMASTFGDFYQKNIRDYFNQAREFAKTRPEDRNLQERVDLNDASSAYGEAINKQHLFGKIGVGFDTKGFMIDLAYQRSFTPYLSDIQYNAQTIPFKMNYGSWNLSVAYRLFPLNKFLTAPRKNKIAAAQKAAIPFYKNEYSFVFGKEGEDINSANVYENSYTRYFKPRFGVTFGLNAMNQTLAKTSNRSYQKFGQDRLFSGFVEAKLRPLYTAKHRLGISGGVNISQRKGVWQPFSSASFDQNGNIISESVGIEPITEKTQLGFQTTADYQYLITRKFGIGVWMRVNGEGFDNPFAQFGVKTSVLF